MTWDYLSADRELFERELESFLPGRIFDSHAHLCQKSQFSGEMDPDDLFGSGPDPMDLNEYQKRINEILPNRKVTGLFFGVPYANVDIAAANEFVSREVSRARGSRGQMLIHPEMDPEFIRESVRKSGFAGLKCYHVWSEEKPTFNSTIPGFLPEGHVRIAHELELTITLHIVRPRALADPSNSEVLRAYSKKYPGARFILAHAARGFNPYHTIQGIGALRGLPNFWFDTSAVTESGAFEAIVRTMGVDRLLYGSDFPITHMRGRCVAFGDSFLWLTDKNTNFSSLRAEVTPTLVGLESLRSLKQACMNLNLSDTEVEAIFFGNAARLYNLDSRPS